MKEGITRKVEAAEAKDIELGRTYKDLVSGIKGVAIQATLYYSGCDMVTLSHVSEEAAKTLAVNALHLELDAGVKPILKIKKVAPTEAKSILLGAKYRSGLMEIEGIAYACSISLSNTDHVTLEYMDRDNIPSLYTVAVADINPSSKLATQHAATVPAIASPGRSPGFPVVHNVESLQADG